MPEECFSCRHLKYLFVCFFSNSGNTSMLFRHPNQLFNYLPHLIICHIYIRRLLICHLFEAVILSLFTHICQCLVAVCFCVFSSSVCNQTRWNLYLKAYLSSESDIVLHSLWMWNVHFGTSDHGSDGAVSVFQDMCSFVSVNRKRDRQWGERDDISDQICQHLFWLLQRGQWITVCVLSNRHQYAPCVELWYKNVWNPCVYAKTCWNCGHLNCIWTWSEMHLFSCENAEHFQSIHEIYLVINKRAHAWNKIQETALSVAHF